ncbi:MAG: DUF885 domain-containing protein, partial [Candidatus Zixiibacteriota bacterium]
SGLLMLSCLVWLTLSTCVRKGAEDQKFKVLVDEFLDGYFKAHPVWATYIGEHKYDGLLDDYSQEAIQAELNRLRSFLERMKTIDTTGLNDTNRVDFKILQNEIHSQLLRSEELKPWEKSPVMYNYLVGGSINSLITRDFAPWEKRLRNVLSRLKQIPRLLEQAKANLNNPPEINTKTAIRQNKGTINLIKNELSKVLDKSPDLKDSLIAESEKAIVALEDYQEFLENDLLPRSKGDFRLGKELYEKKLRYTLQSDLPPDEIVRRAEQEFKNVRKRMFDIALPLHDKLFSIHKHNEAGGQLEYVIIKEVLDEIAKDHPQKDELLAVCRQILKDLEEFVKEKDLLDLTGINPLEVEWEPEFSRGIAVAGLDAPGPLDKDQKSFYRVSPLPDDWTKEQVESYLREYNNYMLVDLSIHEAMPGHYVQSFYANQFPSLVRAIFGNGPFIEGWAMYSERMMVNAGFMDFDPRFELQQLKMYLRAVINSILDAKIHAGDMTKEEAIKLMTEGGFQERSEAEGKWVRACLTSTQLSTYFVGIQEILDLEKDYKERMGERFSQKEFNQKFLSFGSPSVRFLREIILGKRMKDF